jgi:hypothetical protein
MNLKTTVLFAIGKEMELHRPVQDTECFVGAYTVGGGKVDCI